MNPLDQNNVPAEPSAAPTDKALLTPNEKPAVFGAALLWFIDRSGVAVAPAIGYYLVFRYEAAYCAAFGVPRSLVQPNLTTILVFTSAVVAFGPLILGMLEAFLSPPHDSENRRPMLRALRIYMPVAFVIVFVYTVSEPHWSPFFIISGMLLLLCVQDILQAVWAKEKPARPLVYRLQGPFYWYSQADLITRVSRSWFGKYSVYIVLAYLSSVMAGVMGAGDAYRQIVFLVPKSRPESVVVRIYDTHAICVAIDPVSKKPTKKILLGSTESADFAEFETKNIGPLNFE